MNYKNLKECVEDLERHGQLIRIKQELDPNLEIAEIQRRVYQNNGPALLFENVKNSPFPAVSNLFGTLDRARFIFRSSLEEVKKLIEISRDPLSGLKSPWKNKKAPFTAIYALPKKVRNGPVLQNKTTIEKLPQIRCWPEDGGAFVLLPQVYSEDPEQPGIWNSNLGMYRVQLSGNDYIPNKEIGLHYQIRRDIGIHHTKAIARKEPLPVSIFVGGPPSHTLAAVMPLPQTMPEAIFAGLMGKRRFRYSQKNGFTISTDADFCITGTLVYGETKTEGPFGDHLGYYSMHHEFPYIKVDSVYHRKDAIWPFTVVGRPPQEDTVFGELIQEITGSVVSAELPGVEAVHAVDAAGVHPLLLAIARERYVPYENRKPQELLTAANAILGYGPCSLAKYLFISAYEDNPQLDIYTIKDFFTHIFERVNWSRDIHFLTRTTIDTLDYSGSAFNEGSKVIIAAAGEKIRSLSTTIPRLGKLPTGFKDPRTGLPGIMFIKGPKFSNYKKGSTQIEELAQSLKNSSLKEIAVIIIVDDSEFAAKNESNFLWATFTRSNPSHDIYGVNSFTEHKHWGCKGPLIIDARLKPHHTPPLIEDPAVTGKVDELGKKGGPLYKII
ncbi:MAG: UbiD family decarboxylase [bacterium]|nr:UbiD family decarboxylase [bacterium]